MVGYSIGLSVGTAFSSWLSAVHSSLRSAFLRACNSRNYLVSQYVHQIRIEDSWHIDIET